MNNEKEMLSSYQQHSDEQVKECIQFIKWTMKQCVATNADVNPLLLQIRSTPVEQRLSSAVTMLFNII